MSSSSTTKQAGVYPPSSYLIPSKTIRPPLRAAPSPRPAPPPRLRAPRPPQPIGQFRFHVYVHQGSDKPEGAVAALHYHLVPEGEGGLPAPNVEYVGVDEQNRALLPLQTEQFRFHVYKHRGSDNPLGGVMTPHYHVVPDEGIPEPGLSYAGVLARLPAVRLGPNPLLQALWGY